MNKIIVGRTYTDGICEKFAKAGFNVIKADKAFEEYSEEAIRSYLLRHLENDCKDYVFTLDFFPLVSKVCHDMRIKYISWVWDCPHAVLWSIEARNDTNYIFLFDYNQYMEQIERGLNTVYYLPIATDIDFFKRVISDDRGEHVAKYSHDVAFIGNFYDDQYDILKQVKYLPEYTKGYLDSLMNIQKLIWGDFILKRSISDSVWNSLKEYIRWELGDNYEDGVYETTMINIFAQKIAQQERIEMCSGINKRFSLGLYTKSDLEFDKTLCSKGYADYKKQMPLIFNYSKINVNITVRSITSGIPLRVMDVLACGGFLITNYQPEIAEYFEEGKDLVVFNDFDDLFDKIAYYLKHADERKMIAHNGHEKVKELFSLNNKINSIINVISDK